MFPRLEQRAITLSMVQEGFLFIGMTTNKLFIREAQVFKD